MNPLRTRAIQLRLLGKSYNEINNELGVAKSTLSLWLRDVVLSPSAQARIISRVRQGVFRGLIKRNIAQTGLARQRAEKIKNKARGRVQRLGSKDLAVIGAVLYWAEGYKRPIVRGGKERTSHIISFLNSDPEMIRVFVRFLTETLTIPKHQIRLCMRLYSHINENNAMTFWARVTRLSKSNFTKSTYLISGASKLKRPRNRLPYGTLQVAVYSTERFHHLMGLLEGVKEKL